MNTAVLGGPECTGDALGFSADNSKGHAYVILDPEQCPEDQERQLANALHCAGCAKLPPWFYFYGVKGMGVADLNRTLDRLLKEVNKLHGGIYAVVIDGIADFVSDPNKPEEANPLVTRLEAIATDYNCSVIGVIHLNPSPAGAPAKSRGHLGSQLERKCETDLRIVQDKDGITTIFTACARRAPILEKDGPRFAWDVEAGMHVSIQTKAITKNAEKFERLHDLAEEIWGEKTALRYSEVITLVKAKCRIKDSGAEEKFSDMSKFGVIEKQFGLWRIKT